MVTAAGDGWALSDGAGIVALLIGGGAAEHEIRVSACLDGGCGNVILRCLCGQAWDLEPGHTITELDDFAAQHSGPASPVTTTGVGGA